MKCIINTIKIGKPVKHRVKLRRSSSGGIISFRSFRCNRSKKLTRARDTGDQEVNKRAVKNISASVSRLHESLTKSNNNKLIESKVDEEKDNVNIESYFML